MKNQSLRLFTKFVVVVCLSAITFAGDIGFIEEFALSGDRSEALKKLIPGTREYYYYTCLALQGEGRLDEVDDVLKQWIKHHKRTGRVIEIENRQALLRYTENPAESLDFIAQRLSLRFNHQRDIPGSERKLPVSLDQKLISRKTLLQRALDRYKGTVEGLTDNAFSWLTQIDLNADRRRHLLARLSRPDHPNLPKLIVDDLNYRHSRGFGSHRIHNSLLISQLDECLRLKPDLINNTNFVTTYLGKLKPNPDVDWKTDAKEREAYLNRLWSFASELAPAFNSLKAHILYHRLVHDRALGIYDKSRFMTYIALPRNVRYANPEYLKAEKNRNAHANLNADYQNVTLFHTVQNDEPLVRGFLSHFFVKENSITPYVTFIKDTYLKPCLAETKIVNGLGDMEQWYSMLSPNDYKDLKERIDIDFAHTNKTQFELNEPVVLDLYIKNVASLTVKVFEINTLNYYTAHQRQVQTDIDLDGLVANREKSHAYDEPSLRRVKRTFSFPSIRKRGVFVAEFIGNGKSSRAVIRKGALNYLVRGSIAGHVFTVFNEAGRKLSDAELFLAGHHYKAGPDGTITVPYTNKPRKQSIILLDGSFACLDSFQHHWEKYALNAGFYVDRETLLKNRKAEVLVRPSLLLNNTPVTLSMLKQVSLVIESRDREGVNSSKEVKDFKLFEDQESLYTFQVPDNLSTITFTLRGTVENISQNKKISLSSSAGFQLNELDKTDKTAGLHFVHAGGGYSLELLGKTGEPLAEKPVEIHLKHKDFKNTVITVLRSDASGRIHLGGLEDIEYVKAVRKSIAKPRTYSWRLPADTFNYPAAITAKTGDVITIPFLGQSKRPDRADVSLLEVRGNTFTKDWFDAVSINNGYFTIKGLPAGDYNLLFKQPSSSIAVRVTEGKKQHGYIMSSYRQLEQKNTKPIHIQSITPDKKGVTIKIGNTDAFTRVHVLATRYMPAYNVSDQMGVVQFPAPFQVTTPKPESQYVTGRDMGDEFRYILERKNSRTFPGNMLERPMLLLNPWAIRSTETGRQEAQKGGHYKSKAPAATATRGRRGARYAKGQGAGRANSDFVNLDFLSAASVVLTNLEPDKNGLITIPAEALKHHQQLTIIAVSPRDTVCRGISLPRREMKCYDLRLKNGLAAEHHFSEQKKISVARKGDAFVLDDIRSSEFEAYDTFHKVYALFMTLSRNPTLKEFGFIVDWHNLKETGKREKYSKYACHELNFFLSRKDPAFFKKVVLPYLQNKLDKTFMDHWFLRTDLESYLEPWAFAQLNIVERILLARAIKTEKPHLMRHVQDLFDLVPPNVERFNHLFKTAIRGRALESKDDFGLRDATRTVEKEAILEHAARLGDADAPAEMARSLAEGVVADNKKLLKRVAKEEAAGEHLAAGLALARKRADRQTSRSYFAADELRLQGLGRFYRKLEKTKEWVENNYYHLPIEQQTAGLITVNAFWRDYARHDGDGPFLSTRFAETVNSFAEMMFALSVLDLPFEAAEQKSSIEENTFTFTPGSPVIIFHKAITKTDAQTEDQQILVSQNYYRYGERYKHVGNQKLDNFIRDEFLSGTVYGAHIVVTNPTSSKQKLDILLQVPSGAMPVLNGRFTQSIHIELDSYRTWTTDYFFYFPIPGNYTHYPVHVAREEKLAAFAKPTTLNVVAKATKIDRDSWEYISQHGTEDNVISFLKDHNIERIDCGRIAWRMKDRAFFERIVKLLSRRHVYNNTLWSYGIKHNVLPAAREYLKHQTNFLNASGDYINCTLLTIDPVIRKTYQHMEYYPLVNARAHRLGQTRQIVNDRFYGQYMRLLKVLSYKPKLDAHDLLGMTYYLLLQDRIEDALRFFKRIKRASLPTKLQYDYCDAYLGFYTDKPARSRELAGKYQQYPVDRWRKRFAAITAQLDEIEGKAVSVVDAENRTQTQTKLVETEPNLDFEVEAGTVTLTYQNIKRCTVNYYAMDIELLFSRNPFVKQYSGQFAYIQPNATAEMQLADGKTTHRFTLPEEFQNRNVMIEIKGEGVTKNRAYFANAMAVQVSENYGQVSVRNKKSGRALSKVYVKVYARMKNGAVQFYKDGYTDLRGRFDYTSLSTNELDHVSRFSLLILSDRHGAVVKEAAPPKQ